MTQRQHRVLDYIKDYHNKYGVYPSTRSIQRFFGYKSQTAAMRFVNILERQGLLTRHKGRICSVILKTKKDIEQRIEELLNEVDKLKDQLNEYDSKVSS